ncbi:MAG TPA: hypothetical protein VFS05_04815 [Gemmatimonadaceae bacterium]|nr:hypothetical protein [Gemmatimonadaceae bacterium]
MAPPADSTSLANRPAILFQVFGTREAPRMVPVATIDMGVGRLRPIVLDSAGWRALDSMYLRRDSRYTLYQDGSPRGTARVVRGMWEQGSDPVYRLDGCRTELPVALVSLETPRKQGLAIELLASSAELGWARSTPPIDMPGLTAVAQELARKAGEKVEIGGSAVDSLDFRAVAFQSQKGAEPTLVSQWLDSAASSGASPSARARHIFIIADRAPSGAYVASFLHRVNGPLEEAEFRRYIDHLDLDGDGVDEIVTEVWRFRGDTWISVLDFDGSRWYEVLRAPTTWCLDAKSRGAEREAPAKPAP